MSLLEKDFFDNLRKKRNNFLILFIAVIVVFLAAYVFSFYLNVLWVSILIGIFAVIISVLYHYSLIYDKNKLLKFYDSVLNGITQKDTYTFKKTDDLTEHDGVRLLRLICTFEDDGEVFERTLYFLSDLPHPTLKEGQKIKVETHRNIIINIED